MTRITIFRVSEESSPKISSQKPKFACKAIHRHSRRPFQIKRYAKLFTVVFQPQGNEQQDLL